VRKDAGAWHKSGVNEVAGASAPTKGEKILLTSQEVRGHTWLMESQTADLS
jgi:hypothetical protein